MPHNRVRVVASLFAVAALACVIAYKFLLQPVFHGLESRKAEFWLTLLTTVALMAGPLALFMVWQGPFRRRAVFVVDGAAFVVPVAPLWQAWALIVAGHVGMLLPVFRVPGTDRVQLDMDAVFPAVAAVLLAVTAAMIWLPGPAMTLVSEGVVLRNVWRAREIRWDDLAPGGPPHPAGWRMPLLYRNGARTSVPVYPFRMDPVFLATVVRHYVERPENRAAIGTQKEHDRLATAYTAWKERHDGQRGRAAAGRGTRRAGALAGRTGDGQA